MPSSLKAEVETLVATATGRSASVVGSRGVGGGCISEAQIVELADGRRYFIKSNPDPLPEMFEREVDGLRALAAPGVIRVPEPVGVGGQDSGLPFIVMEAVETGRPGADFLERFGRQFATLHRQTRHERFGFDADNYIGSTPQPNRWHGDWVSFWRDERLGFQLDLARRQGRANATLNSLGDRLRSRLDRWIAEPAEPACLLHGDLWGGNYMVDEQGEPVLIDPAVYYGRREADLAMTLLFGGFGERFHAAYREVWPLEDGHDDRLEIYKLYHLLNHLNLFGASYLSGCLQILRRFA